MIDRVRLGATALTVLSLGVAGAARAQDAVDVPGVLAAGVEQLGQSVGEAALGGESVFVTGKGSVRLPRPVPRTYNLSVEGAGPTAAEAAAQRDAKLEKLRAVAKRFSVDIKLGEANYTSTVTAARSRPGRPALNLGEANPATPAPPAPPVAPTFTATTPVQFTRPPEAAMPAFIDAAHQAGIDTFPSTNPPANPVLAMTEALGLGATAPEIDPAIWDEASAAAVKAARHQAETLAAAGGRKLGLARQIILLSKSARDDQATVTVAARFGFAP